MVEIIGKYYNNYKEADLKILNGDNYWLFKRISTLAGLWPYQGRFQRLLINFSLLALALLAILPEMIAVNKFYFIETNNPRFLKAVSTIVCFLQAAVTYLILAVRIEKIEFLCYNIAKNWKLIKKNQNEFKLMKQRTLFGEWFNKIFMVYITMGTILYATIPFSLPLTLDYFFPLKNNETRKLLYVLDGEYMIKNKDNYYIIINCFECVAIYVIAMGCMCIDTVVLTLTFHCVALIDIVKSRLRLSMKLEDNLDDEDMNNVYRKMIQTIKLQKTLTRFTKKVVKFNSLLFITADVSLLLWVAIGANVIMAHLHMPQEVFRFSIAFFAVMIHLVYMAAMGQMLNDNSLTIFNELYNLEWYRCSGKIKKMVLFMMMNSKKPLQLTSENLHPINYEFLGLYVKTATSYIMALASVSAFEEKYSSL